MGRLRFPVYLALFAALALMPAAALAAPPGHEHFRDRGTDVDPDFCGTGQEINGSFDVRINVWIASDSPTGLVRTTFSGKTVFTNPATGDSVTVSSAGQSTDEEVLGDPAGLHTVLITTKGLPEKIQTTHGPVLTRDAGLIAILFTFDGDELLEGETVVVKGPHPEAGADFELFCEVTTEALGIA
jgi:hypothetical protein